MDFSAKVLHNGFNLMQKYYVYQHKSLDANQIFYVGKGKGNRANQTNGRNDYWNNIVNKHGLKVEIIVKDIDEELAFLVEMEAIDVYRRRGIELCNMTDGGEGASGYQHDAEHIEKMKGNTYGQATWGKTFLGKTHSDETKAKWSEIRKGNNFKLGKKVSEEGRKNISLARAGKPLTDEHKKNISQGLKGNKHTAKLSDDDIRFIRANQGKLTHIELGEMFNTHKNNIHRIWRFERYKDVI